MSDAKKVAEYARRWARYERDPVAFMADVFGWRNLPPWQQRALWSTANRPRTAVAGAQGTGKGNLAAEALLHHIGTRKDSKGQVLSASGKTLKLNIWPEIAKLYQRSDQFQRLFELTPTQLVSRWRPLTWFVVGRTAAARYSSSDSGGEKVSEAAAGMYADDTLTVADEASGIDDAVYDAIEGTASTPRRRLLYEGNPVRRTGRFAYIFLQPKFARGWVHFFVSKLDSPWTCTPEARAIWEADIDRYGPQSAYVQARIWGRFPRSGTIDTMVTVDDVMLGWTRGCVLGPDGEVLTRPEDDRRLPLDVGVDPARMGDDLCVIFVRRGLNVLDCLALPKSRETEIRLLLMQLVRKYRCDVAIDDKGNVRPANDDEMRELVRFRIDEGGVGGPLIDELQDDGWAAYGVNNGSTDLPPGQERTYANLGALVYANGSEMLKSMRLWGVPETYRTVLMNQLVSRQYHFTRTGRPRITLLSKEEMRLKGMGSPDFADAFMLCACDLDVLGVAGRLDETYDFGRSPA